MPYILKSHQVIEGFLKQNLNYDTQILHLRFTDKIL
jgi:hypothetical protein